MKFIELIKKPTFQNLINYCLEKAVWCTIVVLFSVAVIKWGVGGLLPLIGPPRPLLFATVNWTSWKAPCCVDVEIKDPNHPFVNVAHANDVKHVLGAESMCIVKVENKGDKEATNPTLAIKDNIYSEVTRGKIGTKEHFMQDEIELGPIQVGETAAVDINAWARELPSDASHAVKEIEIRCEGRPASLYIQTPVRNLLSCFNRQFWPIIILPPLVLLLFHVFIIRLRREKSSRTMKCQSQNNITP
jgi:hypothetical protein